MRGSRGPRSIHSFPATCAPGTRFISQCEHWGRKQIRMSAGRPEIPENFRSAQAFPRVEKPLADFQRPRMRGSSASRKPSPSMFSDSIVVQMKNAGISS